MEIRKFERLDLRNFIFTLVFELALTKRIFAIFVTILKMNIEKIAQNISGKKTKTINTFKIVNVDSFNHCYKVFELSGLEFYSLESVTSLNSTRKISKARLIYMSFVLSVLVILTVIFMFFEEDIEFNSATVHNVVMLTFQSASGISLYGIIAIGILESFCKSDERKQFYANFNLILILLMENFGMKIDDFEKFSRKIRRIILVSLSAFTCFHLIVASFQQFNTVHFVMVTFVAYFPLIFILIVSIRTIFYVELTNYAIKKLNEIVCNNILIGTYKLSGKINTKCSYLQKEFTQNLLIARKIYSLILKNANILDHSWGFGLMCCIIGFIVTLIVSEHEFFVNLTEEYEIGKLTGEHSYCLVVYGEN